MHTCVHTHTLCPPERAAFFFSSIEVWVGQKGGWEGTDAFYHHRALC